MDSITLRTMAKKIAQKDKPKRSLLSLNIARFRKEAGLSQGEVSRFTGIPLVQYVRYEKGKRKPKHEAVVELAKVFGHATDDFTDENPPPRDANRVRPLFRLLIVPGVDTSEAILQGALKAIVDLNKQHDDWLRQHGRAPTEPMQLNELVNPTPRNTP